MKKHNHEYKRNWKRFSLLALLAVFSAGTTGTGVYVSLSNQIKKENENNLNQDEPDMVDPAPLPEENDFSKTINKTLQAKRLNIHQLDLTSYFGSSNDKPVNLSLNNASVDLSKINEALFSLNSDLNVKYNGLDQNMTFALVEDTAVYVSALNGKFAFSAPKTIDDVVNLISKFVALPSDDKSSDALSSIDLSSLLSKVTDALNGLDVKSEKLTDGTYQYTISMGDLLMNGVSIQNINIVLFGNEDHDLTGLQIASQDTPIIISKDNDVILKIYAGTKGADGNQAAISASSESYDFDTTGYSNIDDANKSIFSTLAEIFTKNETSTDLRAGIKVKAQLDSVTREKDPVDENKINVSTKAKKNFDGGFYVDANNITKNFALAKMGFQAIMTSAEDASEEDHIKMAYTGGNDGAIYLDLDDYKGKLLNADSSKMLDFLTGTTGEKAIQVIGNALGKTLDSFSFDTLKSGDVSKILSMVKTIAGDNSSSQPSKESDLTSINETINGISIAYNTSSDLAQFDITLPSSKLGLSPLSSTDNLTLSVKLNNREHKVTDILVKGLSFDSYALSSIEFTLDDYEESKIAIPTLSEQANYVDYKATLGIFTTLTKMISKERYSADYSFLFQHKDSSDSTKDMALMASGNLSADMTGVSPLLEKDATGNKVNHFNKGKYRISLNANQGKDTLDNRLDVIYQDQNLYFGYDAVYGENTDTVFKNYISHASLTDMRSVIDSKSSKDATASLDAMDDVLSLLSLNQNFLDDISALKNNWTLTSGLKSFLSIRNGANSDELILSLNVPYVLEGSVLAGKVGAIDLTISSKDNEETPFLESISVSTYVIDNNNTVSFKITFPEYTDFSLTEEQKSSYQEIQDASSIFEAFYDLNTDLEKSEIDVNAAVDKTKASTKEKSNLVRVNGLALRDKANNAFSGSLSVTTPSLSNLYSENKTTSVQKIEFQKEDDDDGSTHLLAEYNDKMHVLLSNHSVKELADMLIEVPQAEKGTYPVLDYLSTSEKLVKSLPMEDVIRTKNSDILTKYPLIHKVTFDDANDRIILEVSRRLFDATATDNNDFMTLTIGYTSDDDPKITSVSFSTTQAVQDKEGNITDTISISGSISLKDYDETKVPEILPYQKTITLEDGTTQVIDNRSKYINLDNVNTLIRAGLDTTEFNYFDVHGTFNVDLMSDLKDETVYIRPFSFDLDVEYSAFINEGQVYQYVSILNSGKDLGEEGFHSTEFFLQGEDAYVSINETDSGKTTSTSYLTTVDNIKDNFAYYALSLSLDLDSRPAGKTLMANLYHSLGEKAAENGDVTETEVTQENGDTEKTYSSLLSQINIGLESDFSSLISSAIYNQNNQQFALTLDPNSLLSKDTSEDTLDLKDYLSIDNTNINLYHQTIHHYGTKKVTDEKGNVTTVEDKSIDNKQIPFYGFSLGTDINILPYNDGKSSALRLGIRGKAKMSYSNRELQKATSEEEVESIKNDSMKRYFGFIDTFNQATDKPQDKYLIQGYSMVEHEIYDFTSWKLTTFYNSYTINDNGMSVTRELSSDGDYTLLSNWFYYD